MSSARVVVGVDRSPPSKTALRWAAEEARARSASLEVVHVIPHARVEACAMYAPLPMPATPAFDEASRWLADLVARVDTKGLHVLKRVETGDPAHALTRRARSAQLLVVGAHPHRGVLGLTHGSTADACLRAAPCPVVVVPESTASAVGW